MNEWVIIGVPTSAGAHYGGQERAPDALRAADLAGRMTDAGLSVTDAGNVPGAVFAVDHQHQGARNVAAVARVANEVADAVARTMADGKLPLVLGGDCTITLGAVAGLRRRHPDGGLVYLDGDTDVSLPREGSGVLDSMGVSHLLGRGAPEPTSAAPSRCSSRPGSRSSVPIRARPPATVARFSPRRAWTCKRLPSSWPILPRRPSARWPR